MGKLTVTHPCTPPTSTQPCPQAPTNSPTSIPTTAPTTAPTNAPTTGGGGGGGGGPIRINAWSGTQTVRAGQLYSLLVKLTVPAAASIAAAAAGGFHANKPINTTDYSLLVTTAPGSGVVAYKRTAVKPTLKPASLKAPGQKNGTQLFYPRVPMPLYQRKESARMFKVGRCQWATDSEGCVR